MTDGMHDTFEMLKDANVINRLHKAYVDGIPITLERADVELLWSLLGDELGRAEAEYITWLERFREYQLTLERDRQRVVAD